MRYMVFISYTRSDIVTLKAVEGELESFPEIDVVYDKKSIPYGEEVHRTISEKIDECDCVVPILTKRSIQSREVTDELTRAHMRSKFFVPFIEQGVTPEEIPHFLREVNHIRYDLGNFDEKLRELGETIYGKQKEAEEASKIGTKEMDQETCIVVASVGKDRPGLVHRISHEIKKNGGNIELQRSTKMAGNFSMLVLFSLMNANEEKTNSVVKSLNQLCERDFFVYARKALPDVVKRPPGSKCGEIIAEGVDHMGIIETITLLLFENNVNIQTMNYDVINAPMTGTRLFRMKTGIVIPKDADISVIKNGLRVIEESWNIDTLFRFPVPCQDTP